MFSALKIIQCNLCFTQRRKPRGRRTVCLTSSSRRRWTNPSWWRWQSVTDPAAPGLSGTRNQRWTEPSLKLGKKCDWRPEETVLSSVSLYCWAHFNTFTWTLGHNVATLTIKKQLWSCRRFSWRSVWRNKWLVKTDLNKLAIIIKSSFSFLLNHT